jgi:CheY-like chemotaxis protein
MEKTKPKLILLDLMMPVMDGFDFLLAMRARKAWREIPVIVITAKELTDEEHRMLSGKVKQVLEKGSYTLTEVIRGSVAEQNGRETPAGLSNV